MKITFVRHAEVIEEYRGKYNGHIDIPLSQNGKLQAKELAKKLQNKNFDKIYCSDLLRAKETLEVFDTKVKPIFTSELREKSWGIHEGKSFQEIEDSGIKYLNFKQWINALDGEDINQYKENVNHFFYNTLLQDKTQNTLVITHSGFIKILFSIVTECSIEKAFSFNLPYSSELVFNRANMSFTT